MLYTHCRTREDCLRFDSGSALNREVITFGVTRQVPIPRARHGKRFYFSYKTLKTDRRKVKKKITRRFSTACIINL